MAASSASAVTDEKVAFGPHCNYNTAHLLDSLYARVHHRACCTLCRRILGHVNTGSLRYCYVSDRQQPVSSYCMSAKTVPHHLQPRRDGQRKKNIGARWSNWLFLAANVETSADQQLFRQDDDFCYSRDDCPGEFRESRSRLISWSNSDSGRSFSPCSSS